MTTDVQLKIYPTCKSLQLSHSITTVTLFSERRYANNVRGASTTPAGRVRVVGGTYPLAEAVAVRPAVVGAEELADVEGVPRVGGGGRRLEPRGGGAAGGRVEHADDARQRLGERRRGGAVGGRRRTARRRVDARQVRHAGKTGIGRGRWYRGE